MNSRRELSAQTSLRGLAALTVFWAHADFPRLFPDVRLLQALHSVLYWPVQAVDLFFVLSGFILCYRYHDGVTWKSYALDRFSRIYPAYCAALVSMLAMNVGAFLRSGRLAPEFTIHNIANNIIVSQAWPGPFHGYSINPPTWSVSVEILLYILVFPCLHLLIRAWRKPPNGVLLAGVLCFAVLDWASLTGALSLPGGQELYRGVFGFSAGYCIAAIASSRSWRCPVPRSVEMVFLLCVGASLLVEVPLSRNQAIITFPFLAFVSASESSWIASFATRRVLMYFGDISYSLYLWHVPVLKALSVAFGLRALGSASIPHSAVMPRVLFCATSVVGVVVLAHLSHFYFERPVKRWLRYRCGNQSAGG